jgi:hypothetical protein
MVATMDTASNAIKTGPFTLFVPLVVGVWVPQRMLSERSGSAAMLSVSRVIGSVVFTLGVVGYFWCAALFVRAQGTPAACRHRFRERPPSLAADGNGPLESCVHVTYPSFSVAAAL